MIYYYPYPEWFNDRKQPTITPEDTLILWGAGRIGGVAAHCLKQKGLSVQAFCDIAKDKWGTTFCGSPVISPEQLKSEYPNAVVLISTVFLEDISERLIKEGFSRFYDCAWLFMKIDFDGYDFWMEPRYAIRNVEQYLAVIYELETDGTQVDQVFLNITTKCTLRCKNCSMFIPYVRTPCNYPSQDIMKDLNSVLEAVGHIRIVNFYGGEPLLHPDLAAMIRKLHDESRVDRISIITNATILPSEELVEALKNESRCLIRISDYGDISKNLHRLEEIFKTNHIRYEVANYTYWDRPSKIAKVSETDEELRTKFKECTACNVVFILNRKLTICSTGSAICNQGVFPPSEDNYVDLSSDISQQELSDNIIQFFARRKTGDFLDACRYCSGNHCVQFENKVPVAEQTDQLLSFEKLY